MQINADKSNKIGVCLHSSDDVQIRLTEKTPEVLAALKQIGVEIASEPDAKTIFGRIAPEKLSALAEVKQVKYVLPKVGF